ncbi:unnamed protein product [Owenia fusiformis]|uniref:Uncharacterized protein n=1 Tax=Owenia fusiformis TaxID=6347 RepID=A0A8S4P193_OWEFU|nr:unnamed protein product [Owenia fusiformis]
MYGQKKPPPMSESESDWDDTTRASSPDAKLHKAPAIEVSSDEEPSRMSVKSSRSNKKSNNRSTVLKSTENTSKSSKQGTPKSQQKSQPKNDLLDTFTFSDRGRRNDAYSEEEDMSVRSRASKSSKTSKHHQNNKPSKTENPPYDFRDAITDKRNSPAPKENRPPGKDRKGQKYDIPPDSARTEKGFDDSWDSNSEGDDSTGLADIRANFTKPHPDPQPSAPPTRARTEPTTQPVPQGPSQDRNKEFEIDLGKSTSSGKGIKNMVKKLSGKFSPRNDKGNISREPLVQESPQKSPENAIPQPPSQSKNMSMFVTSKEVSVRNNDKGKSQKYSEGQGAENTPYMDDQNRVVFIYNELHTDHYTSLTSSTQEAVTQRFADTAEVFITRGVQEFFGIIRIIIGFILIFVVETIKFVLRYIGQFLLVGTVTAFGDYLIKPLFLALHQSILNPVLTFIWNLTIGLRNIIGPILEIYRSLMSSTAVLLQAFRLVEIRQIPNPNHQSVMTA